MRPGQARLAVDYGTSNTVAMLHWPDGRIRPLLFDSSPLLPSAVCLDDHGRLLSGRAAQRAGRLAPQSYEPNPKRRVDDLELLLGDRDVPVVMLVAATLNRVWQEATRTLSEDPAQVVITYPVEWGPARQSMLLAAARQAGLPEVTLLTEPVAAATYYATVLGKQLPRDGCLVVYDLGAGTFDVSVVRRGEPLSYRGLDSFGGLDLDALVVSIVGDAIGPTAPAEWERLRFPQTVTDRRAFRTLWQDASEAKEALSTQSSAALVVPLVDRDVVLSREQFEQLARPRLAETIDVTRLCIREARVPPEQISALFLVGGGSRMPLISTLLHRATGIAPTVLDQPELVVAEGALRSIGSVVGAPAGAATPPIPISTPSAAPSQDSASPAPSPIPAPPTAGPPLPIAVPPTEAPPPGPAWAPESLPVDADLVRPDPVFRPAERPEWLPEQPRLEQPRAEERQAAQPGTFSAGAGAGAVVLRAFLLALVGLAAFVAAVILALTLLNLGSAGDGARLAGVALIFVGVPGCLLLTASAYSLGALFSRVQVRVDDSGVRILTHDPYRELWLQWLGWALPSVLFVFVGPLLRYSWPNVAGQLVAMVLLLGIAGLLVGAVSRRRILTRRTAWAELRNRLPATADPKGPIEVDAVAWPRIRTVAIGRVGLFRHRAVVVEPVDPGDVRGPWASRRRRLFRRPACAVVDLTASGLPVKRVAAALEQHSGGRLAG